MSTDMPSDPEADRMHELGVPAFYNGETQTVPFGHSSREIELLDSIPGTMTVAVADGITSIAVELDEPVVLMPKPESGASVLVSAEIDGFVLWIGHGSTIGFGMLAGEMVDLLPDVPEAEQQPLLAQLGQSMIDVDEKLQMDSGSLN